MPDSGYEPVGDFVRIFLRGNTWYANYQHAGKQHRKSLRASNKKEARRRAVLLEAELLKGSYTAALLDLGRRALPRQRRWVSNAAASARDADGGPQLCGRSLLADLKTVLKSLGLHGKLHTFRHAFISNALSRGVPEATVRAWAGHVDQRIIRLYTHIADRDSQAKMRRLAEAQNGSDNSNDTEQTQ